MVGRGVELINAHLPLGPSPSNKAATITGRQQQLHVPPAVSAGGGSNGRGGQLLVTDKGVGAAAFSAGNARALDVLGQLRKLIGM